MSDVPEGNQAHGLDFNEQEAVADAVLTLYVGNGVREGLSWRTLFTKQLVGLLLDEELVFFGGGGAELEPRRLDIAIPVLAGERRAATLTPVGGAPGEPG